MIFVDTSFWVAMIAARDARNAEATELLRRAGDEQLVTSNHVRGETWTFLRRRYGHTVAVRFLDRLERSQRITIAYVDDRADADALRWLRRRDEREYSFVDATSFILMRALRLKQAFAFDGDFTAAGFDELRA